RNASRSSAADSPRSVSGRPLLSPERGAGPFAAAARANCGHTGAGTALRGPRGTRGLAAEAAGRGRNGTAVFLSVARKRTRIGEFGAPAGGALFTGDHRYRRGRSRVGRHTGRERPGRNA